MKIGRFVVHLHSIESKAETKKKYVYERNDSKMDWIVFGENSAVHDAARSLRNAKRQL